MRTPRQYLYWLPNDEGVYDWREAPPEKPSFYAYLSGRTKPPRGFRKVTPPEIVTAVWCPAPRRVLHVAGEAVRGVHNGREVLAARFECGAHAANVRAASEDEGIRWCKKCHAIRKSEYSVYAFWANDGTAVYVGQTSNWPYRHAQHRANSEWYPLVAWYSVVATYDNRPAAQAHELSLIKQERPVFNVQGKPVASAA